MKTSFSPHFKNKTTSMMYDLGFGMYDVEV
jgi:hypothetical protein